MPRAGLTPDRIVAEAAVVADEVGVEKLTLAAVAVRCGVSLPGLYKHVGGINAVRRDLAVLGLREITAAIAAAATGLTGRAALRAVCTSYRDYARAHPGRYAAGVLAAAPADDPDHRDASARAVEVLAAALRGYALRGEDLIHAIRMVRAVCHGVVSLDAAGGFALPESVGVTFERLQDALHSQFVTARIESEHAAVQ